MPNAPSGEGSEPKPEGLVSIRGWGRDSVLSPQINWSKLFEEEIESH
jgi:hypothetical protein